MSLKIDRKIMQDAFPLVEVQSWLKTLKEQAATTDRVAALDISFIIEEAKYETQLPAGKVHLVASPSEESEEEMLLEEITRGGAVLPLLEENSVEEYDFEEELDEFCELIQKMQSFTAFFEIKVLGKSGSKLDQQVFCFDSY